MSTTPCYPGGPVKPAEADLTTTVAETAYTLGYWLGRIEGRLDAHLADRPAPDPGDNLTEDSEEETTMLTTTANDTRSARRQAHAYTAAAWALWTAPPITALVSFTVAYGIRPVALSLGLVVACAVAGVTGVALVEGGVKLRQKARRLIETANAGRTES